MRYLLTAVVLTMLGCADASGIGETGHGVEPVECVGPTTIRIEPGEVFTATIGYSWQLVLCTETSTRVETCQDISRDVHTEAQEITLGPDTRGTLVLTYHAQ